MGVTGLISSIAMLQPAKLEEKKQQAPYNVKYVKLTNASNIHNGYEFKEGLNEDNVLPTSSELCAPGYFYFTNTEHFIDWVIYRSVEDPMENVFDVKIPDGVHVESFVTKGYGKYRARSLKYRARSFILSNQRSLKEFLVELFPTRQKQQEYICQFLTKRSHHDSHNHAVLHATFSFAFHEMLFFHMDWFSLYGYVCKPQMLDFVKKLKDLPNHHLPSSVKSMLNELESILSYAFSVNRIYHCYMYVQPLISKRVFNAVTQVDDSDYLALLNSKAIQNNVVAMCSTIDIADEEEQMKAVQKNGNAILFIHNPTSRVMDAAIESWKKESEIGKSVR
jgi:hypothetical protein